MKRLLKRIGKAGIIAVIATALIASGILAAWMLHKPVSVSLTIVPSGDLIVTPAELSFGTVYHTSCVEEDIQFENTTPDTLTVDWDAQIRASDNTTLIIVGTTGSEFELASGQTVTKTITFNVDSNAPYGVYDDLTWNVYAETP